MNELEFLYQDGGVSSEDVEKTIKKLEAYQDQVRSIAVSGRYDTPQASINLSVDNKISERVNALIERFKTDSLTYVIVAGIGGSNLGTKAIYEGVFGQTDAYNSTRKPKILFVDTVNSRLVSEVRGIIERLETPEEIVVNLVTKSGTTTESIANFEIIFETLQKRFGDGAKERIVFTTDEGSHLWNMAEERGIERLAIPGNVGGRFSVLSAVGLFPLSLVGINTRELLSGAESMRTRCTNSLENNPAALSAAVMFLHKKKGIAINNTFFFNAELEALGKWCRQLMGESIGKEHNKEGKEVNEGITPTVAIGSTDLHSMAQLYLGGPKDKFTQFIYAPEGEDARVPEEPFFAGLVSDINGKTFAEIMEAILGGVQNAYRANKIPFVEIKLPEVSEYTLGEFLQFKMFEVMYVAELLGLNAFDQPAVEKYKKETRELLKG